MNCMKKGLSWHKSLSLCASTTSGAKTPSDNTATCGFRSAVRTAPAAASHLYKNSGTERHRVGLTPTKPTRSLIRNCKARPGSCKRNSGITARLRVPGDAWLPYSAYWQSLIFRNYRHMFHQSLDLLTSRWCSPMP